MRFGLAGGAYVRCIAGAGAALLMAVRTSEPQAVFAVGTVIIPRQGMDWGRLVAGVASRIDPRDVSRRGEIDFVGKDKNTVSLVLPSTLVSSDGARLPLRFQTGDLVLQYTGNGDTSTPEPGLPIEIHPNPGQGNVRLFIGGTAAPAINQRTGSYTATITAMFVNTTL